ncbi:MAG: helix-turn-helix transcriptional regulator [Magnetococcales bacterium]|nr:helix-turn-helix transcriptional regulator [Magnetococcales bacterium]
MNEWINRARDRLKTLDMSQVHLGEVLGVSSGAINHYLAGRRDPTPDLLVKMAEALKCDIGWLLTGKVESSGDVDLKGLVSAIETAEVLIDQNGWKISPPLRAQLIAEIYALNREVDERAKSVRTINLIALTKKISS